MTISTPVLVGMLGMSTILVLMVALAYPSFVRSRDLRRRLGQLVAETSTGAVDLGGRRRSRGIRRPRAEGRAPLLRALDQRIERANLDVTVPEVLGAITILAGSGLVIGAVLAGLVGAIAGLLVGAALPILWIDLRHRRRQRAFRSQLADNVALLASSVRAGHSLLQAFEQVARESPEPSRSGIEQVVREIGLGASQEEALERLAQRFPSEDLDLIVASINVQHQISGSLARSLDEMAETLRERQRIEADIRALTSQQRYSAYVLALLPVAVTLALFLVSRDYITLLFEGLLRFAAIAAALMVLLGFIIMRKIATIDV
ncbi:MAG TPA: type II secretion system F family protein [Candidatus Limnocylindria bacterium]